MSQSRGHLTLRVLSFFIWFLLGLITVESWLWRSGYRLEGDVVYATGRPLREFDPNCGWGNLPGSTISAEDERVRENVWANGQRVSRPCQNKPAKYKVLFVGDSMTFGTGVPDEETMVYRLNERYSDICFDNGGVPGTSTWQAYAHLKHTLELGHKYDLVVYNSINAHLARNAWHHVFFGDLQRNHAFLLTPRCEMLANGELRGYTAYPPHWFLDDYLLLPNFLKRSYLGYLVQRDDPKLGTWNEEWVRLFYAIVAKMQALCSQHGARFAYTTVEPTLPDYLEHPPLGITFRPLIFNDQGDPKYFVAHDTSKHPSGLVHAEWFRMFCTWLEEGDLLSL